MDEVPISQTEVKNLRFLRILVTTLTVTMIFGLLTIVALLFIRFTGENPTLTVPDAITLPDGTNVTAFTRGQDWYAIVTGDDKILIYDVESNSLRQTIEIKN